MASDLEITRALSFLLRDFAGDPLTSIDDVVQRLQSSLGVDLTHNLDFIKAQIHLLNPPSSLPPHPCPLPLNDRRFSFHHFPNFYPRPAFSVAPHGSVSHYPSSPNPPVASKPVEPPKESAPVKAKRKGGPGGLYKLCGVSPELQVIVGKPALPRTEIVRQLWAYIRKHNLQDPSNKRKIICNEELKVVFETDCTDMFEMNKLLAKHIITLDPTKQPPAKKQKQDAETQSRSIEPGPYVKISNALANFFGVDEKEMLVEEINKRIWEYINVNQLQDYLKF